MAEPTPSLFGTYATPTQIIIAAAQTEVLALIDVLRDMIPDPDAGTASSSIRGTPFDLIDPIAALQLRAELAAIKTAVDAAPIA